MITNNMPIYTDVNILTPKSSMFVKVCNLCGGLVQSPRVNTHNQFHQDLVNLQRDKK